MKRRIGFLRFVYLYGAAFDGLMLIPMLSPAVGARMLGIAEFRPGPDYRYAMGVAAALMAGWTALLVWGVLDPVARRGALLLTAAPVSAGLVAAGLYAVAAGLVALPDMAPIFAFQTAGIALFVAGYRTAGRLGASATKTP
ncbi:MAG: hypothetical protein ABSC22_20330 [Roseiarcus sp.]|jgi:hypothetical protein